MADKIKVKTKSVSYAYVVLHNAAVFALDDANTSKEGRFYHCLYAMQNSAFSLEAYLNHIGSIEEPNWEKIERNMNPLKK